MFEVAYANSAQRRKVFVSESALVTGHSNQSETMAQVDAYNKAKQAEMTHLTEEDLGTTNEPAGITYLEQGNVQYVLPGQYDSNTGIWHVDATISTSYYIVF